MGVHTTSLRSSRITQAAARISARTPHTQFGRSAVWLHPAPFQSNPESEYMIRDNFCERLGLPTSSLRSPHITQAEVPRMADRSKRTCNLTFRKPGKTGMRFFLKRKKIYGTIQCGVNCSGTPWDMVPLHISTGDLDRSKHKESIRTHTKHIASRKSS